MSNQNQRPKRKAMSVKSVAMSMKVMNYPKTSSAHFVNTALLILKRLNNYVLL